MICFETGFAVLLNIETWKNWVPIISLFVAIGALGVAYWQVQVGRNTSASAQAHGIYQQYLTLCIAHPKFASGGYVPKNVNDDEYAKYTWFFSSMLFAFEQILEAKPNDEKWGETVKHQLEKHKVHLLKSRTAASNQWHESLEKIINEIKETNLSPIN
ncbi:hypothetical protein [Pseudoalteromonas luteoviolacea]|uniref:hypothetical protein n=1 Tax=Pseudoalteromonas luteoviolacea TaxID=43657 RepID=UPI001B36BFB1|nr:hypothetical protein [Pseudoalteromonas luteoviolacea]MBQ4837708.1 hypothetical protein [Pseudoalteromonas luteoviolacea]